MSAYTNAMPLRPRVKYTSSNGDFCAYTCRARSHADQLALPKAGGLTLNRGMKNVDKPKARITRPSRLLVLLKGFIYDS